MPCQYGWITPDARVCLSDLCGRGQQEIGNNLGRIRGAGIERDGQKMHIGQCAAIMNVGAHGWLQFTARNGGRCVCRIESHSDINLGIGKKLTQCRIVRRIAFAAAPQIGGNVLKPYPQRRCHRIEICL